MRREKPRPMPPLLRDDTDEKRSQAHHKRPKRQERKVAEAVGGRRVSGSGSSIFSKGDVRREDPSFPLLVECKRSMGKKSIRLEADWLTKITAEAMGGGKYPAIALQFDKKVMNEVARARRCLPAGEDWIAVPLTTFQAMLEALGEEGLGL